MLGKNNDKGKGLSVASSSSRPRARFVTGHSTPTGSRRRAMWTPSSASWQRLPGGRARRSRRHCCPAPAARMLDRRRRRGVVSRQHSAPWSTRGLRAGAWSSWTPRVVEPRPGARGRSWIGWAAAEAPKAVSGPARGVCRLRTDRRAWALGCAANRDAAEALGASYQGGRPIVRGHGGVFVQREQDHHDFRRRMLVADRLVDEAGAFGHAGATRLALRALCRSVSTTDVERRGGDRAQATRDPERRGDGSAAEYLSALGDPGSISCQKRRTVGARAVDVSDIDPARFGAARGRALALEARTSRRGRCGNRCTCRRCSRVQGDRWRGERGAV